MLRLKAVLAAFVVLSAAPSLTFAADTNVCDLSQLTAIRTDFPLASQARGEYGQVSLKITVSKDGRASQAQVTQSSGYTALDKAAAKSVTTYWLFDVAHCAATALPATSHVTVQFKRAPQYTVSGTVNTHRATANSTHLQSSCDTARDSVGDQIVACLVDASLAGRHTQSTDQPTLANRADISLRK